ncbi:MAG TPA: hypothetical protein VD970_00485 [Acetobacteraceae bacterium]|nr:hypothetical protein [Acetobacteraceae bacterium]
MRMLRVAALALCAGGFTAPAQAAGMSSGWENISMSQDQCLNAAADIVQRLGFSVQRDTQTVFGWRGDDGITVRCIAARQLAVLFTYVASGGSEESGRIIDQLRGAFRGGGQPQARPGTK